MKLKGTKKWRSTWLPDQMEFSKDTSLPSLTLEIYRIKIKREPNMMDMRQFYGFRKNNFTMKLLAIFMSLSINIYA